jgi:hypothetical protein
MMKLGNGGCRAPERPVPFADPDIASMPIHEGPRPIRFPDRHRVPATLIH